MKKQIPTTPCKYHQLRHFGSQDNNIIDAVLSGVSKFILTSNDDHGLAMKGGQLNQNSESILKGMNNQFNFLNAFLFDLEIKMDIIKL